MRKGLTETLEGGAQTMVMIDLLGVPPDKLVNDARIPDDVRRRAKTIARHFPCIEDLTPAGRAADACLPLSIPDQHVLEEWSSGLGHGPLTWRSRVE